MVLKGKSIHWWSNLIWPEPIF